MRVKSLKKVINRIQDKNNTIIKVKIIFKMTIIQHTKVK